MPNDATEHNDPATKESTDLHRIPEDPETDVCPECGSVTIRRRYPGHNNSMLADDAPQYRCVPCGATFDDPETRERHLPAEVRACPACDDADINHRKYPPAPDAEYHCVACGHEFAEPVIRPPKYQGGNQSAAYRALEAADPDDLRADGGWSA